MLDNSIIRVSGHIEDLDARPEGKDLIGQLTAIKARHNHIGQEEVDFLPVFLDDF